MQQLLIAGIGCWWSRNIRFQIIHQMSIGKGLILPNVGWFFGSLTNEKSLYCTYSSRSSHGPPVTCEVHECYFFIVGELLERTVYHPNHKTQDYLMKVHGFESWIKVFSDNSFLVFYESWTQYVKMTWAMSLLHGAKKYGSKSRFIPLAMRSFGQNTWPMCLGLGESEIWVVKWTWP